MKDDLLRVWNPTDPIKTMGEFCDEIEQLIKPREHFAEDDAKKYCEKNRFLFRGVASADFALLPNLARLSLARPWMDPSYLIKIEEEVTCQFRQKSRLYVDAKFLPDGLFETWQIMQHHGAPTRLLDWSVSPFLALYFALCETGKDRSGNEVDAAVWAVEHNVYMHHANEGKEVSLAFTFSEILQPLFERSMEAHKSQTPPPATTSGPRISVAAKKRATGTAQASNPSETPKTTNGATRSTKQKVLFMPCQLPNHRMAAQRGWFSVASNIHDDHGEVIAEQFKEVHHQTWCKKIVIDKNYRGRLLRDLWRMNITAETVYLGLDGLGKSLMELPDLLKPEGRTRFFMEEGNLAATMAPP
jgi:hypothetical protein